MKAEKTRRHILEKAAPLFNARGFDGTSLTDLEQATGLTKGALYGNFTDKETLAAEAFAYAIKQVKAKISGCLQSHTTYREKFSALLDFFAQYVLDPPVPGGCPLMNAAVEADDHRTHMRPVIAAEITKMVGGIATLLQKGIDAGEFRKDIDVRGLSYTFFCALEGAIMFSRVEGTREPMDIVIQHLRHKLDQITCSHEG